MKKEIATQKDQSVHDLGSDLNFFLLTGIPTETTDPNLWELADSRLTAEDPVWDETRSSASGQLFCSLVYFWDSWKWDQDLPLVHE